MLKIELVCRALIKSVVLLLLGVMPIVPAKGQSGIDTVRNECKGSFSLSARNILNDLNTNSLRISNLYQAKFSNWNTWNKDYALSFWVEIEEGLDATLFLNNWGFGGGSSGHSISVESDSISLYVQNGGVIKRPVQTGWNQIGFWVKQSGSTNNIVFILNGIAVDSMLSVNKYEGFQFGSSNSQSKFAFNLDDIVLFIDSLNRKDFIEFANKCLPDSIQNNVTNYYNFESYTSGTIIGNFKNLINNQYDFQGTNYSSGSIVESAPNCGNYPTVSWSTGDSTWNIISPAGSTIYCSVGYSGQIYTDTIVLPQIQSYQNLSDLFPDTIRQFGNTVDTIINWMNWPPDTSIVYGAGIEFVMPNNAWSNISKASGEISNSCTITNQKVTFKKSGFYKFYKNYWGSGLGMGCWEEELVFIQILDSLNIIDVNASCDTNSLFVSARVESNTHISPNYIQDRNVSEYQDLNEFTLYMRHFPTGTLNGKSQFLGIFPNMLEIKLLPTNHLRIYSGLDSVTTASAITLNVWQSLVVSLTGERLLVYVNGKLVATFLSLDQIMPPINGGIDFGSASWLWPLNGFYGYSNNFKYDFYKGAYSEISTWKRALEASEIENLDKFSNQEDDDLIGLYTFGYGSDVHDYSHNLNNLYFSSGGVLPIQTADSPRVVHNGNLIGWDELNVQEVFLNVSRPVVDSIFAFSDSMLMVQNVVVPNLNAVKNTIKQAYLSCDLKVVPDIIDSSDTYVWSQAGIVDSALCFYPSDTGKFELTVYKGSCSRTFNSRIDLFEKPNYSILKTDPSCANTPTGRIDVVGDSSIIVFIDANYVSSGFSDSLSGGLHFIQVISSSGCAYFDTVSLIDPPTFSVVINLSNPSCYGSSDGEIQIALNGGVNPYVSLIDTALSGLQNFNLNEGTYEILVGDSSTTCEVDTIMIQLIGPPPFTSNLVDSAYITCMGEPLYLTPMVDSNFSYILFHQNAVIDTGLTFTIVDTGLFTLREYLSDSCYHDKDFIHVKYPEISLATSTQDPSCFGTYTGITHLILNSNTDVLWHDGDTNVIRSNLLAGIYKFTLTDQNGCSRIDSVILVDPAPLNISYSKSNITCFGASNGVININVNGGIGTPNVNWLQPFVSGFNPNNLDTGTYSFYITDSSSCLIDTFDIHIASPDSLVLNLLSQENVLCYGNQSGKVFYSYSGGASYGGASLKNISLQTFVNQSVIRDSINIFSNLIAGTYLLKVVDSSGCMDSTIVVIGQPSAPFSVLSSNFNASKCLGDSTGNINISVAGGVPPYSISWNLSTLSGFNLVNLPDGVYSALLSDSNNCQLTVSFTLNTTQITPFNTNPSICMITFDYSSQKNKVVWESPINQGIDTFYIYRNDFGVWNNIGGKAAEDSTYYLDLTSSPLNKTHEYSIVLKDSCGVTWGTTNNNTHTTSLLQSSMGTNGQVNLSWTNYIGAPVSYFRILRKVSNGAFAKIDSVNNTAFTYVDNSPPVGILEYMVEAVLPISCSINPLLGVNSWESSGTTINSIRSNSILETTIDVIEFQNGSLTVYPNPNNGSFKVEHLDPSLNYAFSFVDFSGRILKEGEINSHDPSFSMENLPSGVYNLILVTTSDLQVIRVVIQ